MGGYNPVFDDRKLQELVLFVATRSKDDPGFDAMKLNAILYYADFYAYRRLGRPISGANYQKFADGPAAQQLPAARESLERAGLIEIEKRPAADEGQQRIVATQSFEPELLSKDEVSLADEVIALLRQKTGREAADMAREEPGWKTVDYRETIPYTTAWLSSQRLTPDQLERARRMAKKHELLGR